MMFNQEIREIIDKKQAEIQATFKKTIDSVGTNLKPEERAEIEKEFQELNEFLEKLKTGLVYIALFGNTGVGKSSIVNSLIGANIAELGVRHDIRNEQTPYKKEPWYILEMPGFIMHVSDYLHIAIEEAKKAHGLIFVIDAEPYEPELKLFECVHNAVPNIPKIVFVNKWDVREFVHDETELQFVRQKIREKMGKFVKSPDDIIYGSARIKQNGVMVRQELPQLLNKMYEDASTLGQVMNILDPAHRTENASQNISNKILATIERGQNPIAS